MAFPDIHAFPESQPGPYEQQMGRLIAGLLHVFVGRVPDAESNTRVLELATNPGRWSAGHAVFDEVRGRLLSGVDANGRSQECQYGFEESCSSEWQQSRAFLLLNDSPRVGGFERTRATERIRSLVGN